MPDLHEIIRSLTGTWILARRDLAGYSYFNHTAEGFWRSFTAIIFIAPVLLVFASFDLAAITEAQRDTGETPDAAAFYFGKLVMYVVGWISFPIIMVFVARALSLTRNYALYIIVFNWSSILVEAVLLAPAAMFYIGLIGAKAAGGLGWICLLLAVLYRWFIAKTALETTGLVASALVLLEFTLAIAISKYGGALLG